LEKLITSLLQKEETTITSLLQKMSHSNMSSTIALADHSFWLEIQTEVSQLHHNPQG
jgi:tryptophanyl-tRNA synthetase